MNVNVTPMPEKPAVEEPKRRTITLTNRAPIQIIEDEWPVISHGMYGEYDENSPYSWKIEVRVRHGSHNRVIVHASYVSDGPSDDDGQVVRVGRATSYGNPITSQGLWTMMLEVGEELRSRIDYPKHQRYVTHALDRCFADLKPLTF